LPVAQDKSSSFDTYRQGGTTITISLLIKMVLVVRKFRNQTDEKLRAIGQSIARMEALGALMNMQGQQEYITQNDLAQRLRVEGPTITRIVDILSKEGLVERQPHPSDRRSNVVRITPAGEVVLQQIFEIYDAVRESMFEGMPEADMLVMHGFMNGMLNRLEADVDELALTNPNLSYAR
jgi:MarR family transcriptional regulator, transcriptional regulator for hemolysin